MRATEAALRIGQAAARLGITAHHARQLCRCGLVEAEVSTGGQWRIPLVEIERLERDGVPAAPTLMQESEPSEVARPSPSPGLYRDASDELAAAAESVEIVARRVQRHKLELEDARVDDEFQARAGQRAIEEAENGRRLAEARAKQEHDQWLQGKVVYALSKLPQDASVELKRAACDAALKFLRHTDRRILPDQMLDDFLDDSVQTVMRADAQAKRAEWDARQRGQLEALQSLFQTVAQQNAEQCRRIKGLSLFAKPTPQLAAPGPEPASVDAEVERQARRRAVADKADQHLGHINTYLKAEYEFTGGWPEQRATAARLRPAILAALTDALEKAPNMNNAQIRDFIEREIEGRIL